MLSDKFYIVQRHSADNDKITTTIVAGPFDTSDEAHNVQAESFTTDEFPSGTWYDVWDEGVLRARGYLP